jgi:succinate-semialdehyde dehydrogenase/glutarate-semialdehyde dehydrogenase
MVTRKVAPALAAGCTVVLKPAESTPLTAAALAELARRAGVPPGAFNLVSGDAPAIGDALLRDPAVRKLGFTGSTAVGKALAAKAAATVKRVSLELGGNAPFIVCADADLDAAATALAASAFRNAGQTCISASRALVAREIAPEFAALVAARVARLRPGRGLDPGSTLGPLISAAAVDRVRAHVDDAVARGAVLAATVPVPDAPELAAGNWARPALLTGADPGSRVFREETFGPVVALTEFATLDEAVQLANGTPYGLAAYAFTSSHKSAWRLADALEFGIVGVNDVAVTAENAPFGGVKESGVGRESGRWGVDEFLDHKYVSFGGV